METEEEKPSLLIVGCGGIGGVIAASLAEQGHRLTVVTRRPAVTEAIRLRGFELRDELGTRQIRGEVELVESIPERGTWDFALLAVPPAALAEAARAAAPLLGANGVLVCFQNGLSEERLAPIVGPDRVIGAVVAWGASSPEPGVYERTSAGGFTLGRVDGAICERMENLARILEALGPVELSENLAGARWSKLALNCAVSSLGTLGGDTLGALLRHRFVRRLALEVMTEAVEVAKAEGVKLEKVGGTIDLQWIALTGAERQGGNSPSMLAKHALLLAVGARYRRLRSSMLAAIERGREPGVDFLNGEVVARAKRHGMTAPINERVLACVHALAKRQTRSDLSTLRQIYDETRAV